MYKKIFLVVFLSTLTLLDINFADAFWQSNGNNIYNTNIGNVGIGTTSPESPLTIKTATGKYGLVHTDGLVKMGTFVWNTSIPGGWLGTQSNHNLYFFTNNSNPKVTIDTTGRMGVGTTTPFYPFETYGSIGIGNTTSGYIFSNRNREIIAGMDPTGFYFAGGAGSKTTLPINFGDYTSLINFKAGHLSRMVIVGSTGNVGVGTISPSERLTLNGGYLRLTSGATGGDNVNLGTYMTDTTGNNEFLQSTGGKPSYSAGYRVTPSGTAATVQLNTATDFRWYTPTGLTANVVSNPLTPDMVFTGGKLGIGTLSPTQKLTISGGSILLDNSQSIKFKDSSGTERNVISFSSADNVTVGAPPKGDVYINSSSYLIVKSTGRVGIGTTTPGAKLDVAGDIKLSGNLVSDGDICIGKCQ